MESAEFKAMVTTLVSLGGNKNSYYDRPSRFRLSNKLDDFRTTLTSDGWSDPNRHPIINYMLVCTKGSCFVRSVDASGETKDADYIAAGI